MRRTTLAILEELQKAHWFSRVGVPDTPPVIVVASWKEAIDLADSPEWENLRLDMAYQIRRRLAEQRRAKWNDVVDDLKKPVIPFVRGKIEPVVREHKLPKGFENRVQWDILHVCLETEYADVYPPGFYASLASWYIKRHFPCGWQGVFPQGMQIVY